MGGIPKPKPCFLDHQIKSHIDSDRQVYKNIKGNRYYTWDSMHGEIEVFDKRGVHLGVFAPSGPPPIKEAVAGRKIAKPN